MGACRAKGAVRGIGVVGEHWKLVLESHNDYKTMIVTIASLPDQRTRALCNGGLHGHGHEDVEALNEELQLTCMSMGR